MLLVTEAVATVAAIFAVVVPWLGRGLDAGRQELELGILLAFATGLFSIWAMVSIALDIGGRQLDGSPLAGE